MVPSAFGSGSHGGLVTADAEPASKGAAIAMSAVTAPIATDFLIRTVHPFGQRYPFKPSRLGLSCACCRHTSAGRAPTPTGDHGDGHPDEGETAHPYARQRAAAEAARIRGQLGSAGA